MSDKCDKYEWEKDDIQMLQEAQLGELTARDRPETDACERGTPGCSVNHILDSECQAW